MPSSRPPCALLVDPGAAPGGTGAALSGAGYEVVACAGPTQALRELSRREVDVAVIRRGRGDPLLDRLVQRMLDDPRHAGVRVVVLGEGAPAGEDAAARVRVVPPGGAEEGERLLAAIADRGPPAERPRVLVVDDSPTFRARARAALAGGHEVLEAENGDEALAVLGREAVDAVLLDKGLPTMSGIDVLRALRECAEQRTLPVLMVTADDDRAAVVESLAAGADDFVPKGGDDEVLLARLRAQLRRSRAERDARVSYADLLAERGVAEARAEMLAVVNRQAADLAHANEELSRFAAVAAHDLQEPLRMISMHLDLIDRRDGAALSAFGRDALATARDAADRMRQLVARVLEYTRSGWQGGPSAPVDARAVADEVLSDLSQAIAAADGRVEVAALPTVAYDRDALRQVLQNLVSNALKYRAPDRPPRIRVAAETAPDAWVFTVADNGQGIDEAQRERIFRMFARAHSGEAGSGIGLALCWKIVTARGGRIGVDSTPGAGSTFWFTVPRSCL